GAAHELVAVALALGGHAGARLARARVGVRPARAGREEQRERSHGRASVTGPNGLATTGPGATRARGAPRATCGAGPPPRTRAPPAPSAGADAWTDISTVAPAASGPKLWCADPMNSSPPSSGARARATRWTSEPAPTSMLTSMGGPGLSALWAHAT